MTHNMEISRRQHVRSVQNTPQKHFERFTTIKNINFQNSRLPPPKKTKIVFFLRGGHFDAVFFYFFQPPFWRGEDFFYGTHLGHFSRTFLVLGRYSLFISFMMCLMQLNEQFCYKMQSTHVCEKKFSHTQHKIH